MSGANAQAMFRYFKDFPATTHMAGGSLANSHKMIATPGQIEVSIESGYTEHLASGQLQKGGNLFQRLLGQIAKLLLHPLQDGNECTPFTLKNGQNLI
jgi:hypothetical protein